MKLEVEVQVIETIGSGHILRMWGSLSYGIGYVDNCKDFDSRRNSQSRFPAIIEVLSWHCENSHLLYGAEQTKRNFRVVFYRNNVANWFKVIKNLDCKQRYNLPAHNIVRVYAKRMKERF